MGFIPKPYSGNPGNMWVSLWRTLVMYVSGFIVVQAARIGVELDDATVVGALTVGAGYAYYIVVRWLEQRVGERWGWLLGWPAAPNYLPVADAGKDGRSGGDS